MWKSAVFWPLLCPEGIHVAHFVYAWYAQPHYEGAILAGCSGGNLGDSLTYDSILLFNLTLPGHVGFHIMIFV